MTKLCDQRWTCWCQSPFLLQYMTSSKFSECTFWHCASCPCSYESIIFWANMICIHWCAEFCYEYKFTAETLIGKIWSSYKLILTFLLTPSSSALYLQRFNLWKCAVKKIFLKRLANFFIVYFQRLFLDIVGTAYELKCTISFFWISLPNLNCIFLIYNLKYMQALLECPAFYFQCCEHFTRWQSKVSILKWDLPLKNAITKVMIYSESEEDAVNGKHLRASKFHFVLWLSGRGK